MQVLCPCICHVDERDTGDLPCVEDAVAAATACSACLPLHTPALRSSVPANAPVPARQIAPDWVEDEDGEGMEA